MAYEPNSLAPEGPREDPHAGFRSFPQEAEGVKVRQRPESFADHYTQARTFWLSMTEPEQRHIVSAFAFELGKVETPAIRSRMLGHLELVHDDLGRGVAAALGMKGGADAITPAVAPRTNAPSPALSLIVKAPETLRGRKIAILLTDGSDAGLLAELRRLGKAQGFKVALVAPRIGGVTLSDGEAQAPDHALSGAPSCLFDAVVVAPAEQGAAALAGEAAAIDWIRDAFGHLKAIGHLPAAKPLFDKAQVDMAADEAVVSVTGQAGTGRTERFAAFLAAAKRHRHWAREPAVRTPG